MRKVEVHCCPICGSDKIRLVHCHFRGFWNQYYRECVKCHCRGQSKPTILLATKAWDAFAILSMMYHTIEGVHNEFVVKSNLCLTMRSE